MPQVIDLLPPQQRLAFTALMRCPADTARIVARHIVDDVADRATLDTLARAVASPYAVTSSTSVERFRSGLNQRLSARGRPTVVWTPGDGHGH